MLRAFAQMRDLSVGLLKCDYAPPSAMTDDERAGVESLTEIGVKVLEPFQFPEIAAVRNGYARMLAPRLEDHYPCARHASSLESVVKRFGADVILIPWSEWLTGACADIDVPKFAYYGNPDTKSWNARLRFQWANGAIGIARFGVETLLSHHLERAHLRQAMKYEWFGNVAHNDAIYYQQHGHKNAFYIQNIWVDRGLYAGSHALAKQGSGRGTVARIIANVGKLGGTANTLGLHYLGHRLLPELQRTLTGTSYEIHILGAGEPHPAAAKELAVPELLWRGFVDDIDAELSAATVFLCVNNATDFKVGHTRYLHAWSLGTCVVAHRDAALSMPEIRHNENALLGNTPDEIAYWVAEAARNEPLRRRIGDAGYETFRSHFTAERVTSDIVERIRAGSQSRMG